MTYDQNDQNAIDDAPIPAWIKTMRALVYALIIVSILAMLTLIYAAFSIISKETDLLDVSVPDYAALISVTQLADGRMIVIYDQDGLHVELRGDDGNAQSQAKLP